MNSTKNNLHSREECPECHFSFIGGYDANNLRRCPSCQTEFVSGQKRNHGSGCSVCAARYKGANNVYYKDGCPALMSDGRFVTNYNSSNELTENMRKLNGFNNSNRFRNFMQASGDLFMKAERNHIVKENTCAPSVACSQGWRDLRTNGNWPTAI